MKIFLKQIHALILAILVIAGNNSIVAMNTSTTALLESPIYTASVTEIPNNLMQAYSEPIASQIAYHLLNRYDSLRYPAILLIGTQGVILLSSASLLSNQPFSALESELWLNYIHTMMSSASQGVCAQLGQTGAERILARHASSKFINPVTTSAISASILVYMFLYQEDTLANSLISNMACGVACGAAHKALQHATVQKHVHEARSMGQKVCQKIGKPIAAICLSAAGLFGVYSISKNQNITTTGIHSLSNISHKTLAYIQGSRCFARLFKR